MAPVALATTSTTAITSGGLTVNLIYDANALAAPASFRAGIETAAGMIAAAISDPITVNLTIHYAGTGGGANAGPDGGLFESYSTVRSDLIANESPGTTIFDTLPSGSSIQGQSQVAVWNAQLKLFGFLSPTADTDDGEATFATDIDPNLLVGVALHELTHAMGRVPYGPQPDIFDLFRFTSAGNRLFLGDPAAAPAAYFSIDGGNTKLADYGQTSDTSDLLNSGVQGPFDAFNEFYSNQTIQQLSAVDLTQMLALGYHREVAAPDLTASTLTLGSMSLGGGRHSGTVSYEVQNIGMAVAGAATSKVYLASNSTISTSDTVLATISDAALAAGTSRTDSMTINLPSELAPGTYWIGAIADTDNQVAESDEANNTTTPVQITVTASISVGYNSAAGGVYTDLAAQFTEHAPAGQGWSGGPGSATPISTDPLFGIHNVVGSSFDDLLVGGTLSGTLAGAAGNDLIYGNTSQATADNMSQLVLDGGNGVNALYGSSGFNIFMAGNALGGFNQIWGAASKMAGVSGYANNTISFAATPAGGNVYVDPRCR